MPARPAQLLAKANAAAVRFMHTEVETGLSFARMAAHLRSRKKAHPHDAEKTKRYLGYARLAYDTVSSRIGTVTGEREELREISEKVAELQKALERF